MPGDGVDQSAVEVAASGMHHHACRFVDDHQLVVLIDHVEWNLLWLDGGVEMGTVEHQRDDVARSHLVVALHRFLVYMHKTGIGCLLDAVSAGVLQFLAHEFIHSDGHLSTVHLKAVVLIELLLLLVAYIIQGIGICHYLYGVE